MKVKEAIAVMNESSSSIEDLIEAQVVFASAGFKTLSAQVTQLLKVRSALPVETVDAQSMKEHAGKLLMAKVNRELAEH